MWLRSGIPLGREPVRCFVKIPPPVGYSRWARAEAGGTVARLDCWPAAHHGGRTQWTMCGVSF
eukprot:2127753-Pyramimonas_sp.AAC.1